MSCGARWVDGAGESSGQTSVVNDEHQREDVLVVCNVFPETAATPPTAALATQWQERIEMTRRTQVRIINSAFVINGHKRSSRRPTKGMTRAGRFLERG